MGKTCKLDYVFMFVKSKHEKKELASFQKYEVNWQDQFVELNSIVCENKTL